MFWKAAGKQNQSLDNAISSDYLIDLRTVISAMSWALRSLASLPLGKLMSDGVGIAAISSHVSARRASRLTVREILSYE
jgi:hypothetical protein